MLAAVVLTSLTRGGETTTIEYEVDEVNVRVPQAGSFHTEVTVLLRTLPVGRVVPAVTFSVMLPFAPAESEPKFHVMVLPLTELGVGTAET